MDEHELNKSKIRLMLVAVASCEAGTVGPYERTKSDAAFAVDEETMARFASRMSQSLELSDWLIDHMEGLRFAFASPEEQTEWERLVTDYFRARERDRPRVQLVSL